MQGKYCHENTPRSELIAQAAVFLHRAGYSIESIEEMLPVNYQNIYGRDFLGNKIVLSYYFKYRNNEANG
jgi:hypothetical protein